MVKRYTAQIKFQVVLQVLTGEKSIAQIAKEQSIHPNSINKWLMEFKARGHEIYENKQVENAERQKIARLEQLLGQKEVEIALLKNFLGQID
jgi:transposase-like protein